MTLKILIASAGRRNYLVEWFKSALDLEKIQGQVFVGDCNSEAPAQYSSDEFILLPRVDDPSYGTIIEEVCRDHSIDLALSLNDYENSLWAELGFAFHNRPTKFICLPPRVHKVLEDKLATYDALTSAGLNVPLTVSATDILNGSVSTSMMGERIVIKNRFGSGSYGLKITHVDHLTDALDASLATVRDARGRSLLEREHAAHSVVLQSYVKGREHGVDIVNDFKGSFAGVLARKKIAMRDGETSSAETVDSALFDITARSLSNFTKHLGLIDTDIICDEDGKQWVIDINPRFGGGYPFSHFAGADIPRAYVRWASGKQNDNTDLLTYAVGATSHKTISIVGRPVLGSRRPALASDM